MSESTGKFVVDQAIKYGAKFAGRSVLAYSAKIEELDRELTTMIGECGRVVDVQALRGAKKTGMGSSF